MHPHDTLRTTSTMERRRSLDRTTRWLKIIQKQVGHAYASTTAIYTGVSDEFRTSLVDKALRRQLAELWEVPV
jgi:integrase